MKKFFIFIILIMFISPLSPLYADNEFELGISLFPKLNMGEEESILIEDNEESFMNNWLIGFHLAYNVSILYISLDSFVIPPEIVYDMTKIVEEEEIVFDGHYRPGFINFLDAGVKVELFDLIVGFAEMGFNYLYVYKQSDIPDDLMPGSMGVNLRLGAGVKFNWWGVTLTGTTIFPSFDRMFEAFKGLRSDDDAIKEAAKDQFKFVPTIMFVFYLG